MDEPFERLIAANQLMAYRYEGFWRAMDTLRDRQLLEELVERGETVACVDVYKGWLEVDTFEDYQRAWAAIKA